jgi:hypothetical protein
MTSLDYSRLDPHSRADTMAGTDLKPLPKLSNETLEEITDAIVSGYDLADLSRVLHFKWGFVLANYVNTHQGFRFIVSDLIEWTERKGKTRELLAVTYSQAPGNTDLQAIAAKCGLTLQDADRKYNATGIVPKPASLEAMVNAHSRLIDYERFVQRLRDAGERVCLVETPFKKGTGFLIDTDCALTNFHVVEEIIANKTLASQVVCKFDYRTSEGELLAPKLCKLSADGILANSPYSESDLTGNGDSEPDKLDYALLRLAGPVAARESGKPRGWFILPAESPVVALHDFLVIPQHAESHPLQIAWGSVVAFPGNRIRYDTTTAQGSSGSPCFTADLDIVGLHHAAEPKHNPAYNQAVPLWLVARDLAGKGVRLETD